MVDANALNPNSRWHRAFNLGFPNAFDRAHRRTGSYLMVHGGCASIGCYAMTNAVMDEIWRVVTAALKGGQRRFHVHIFPFRMTEDNLARRGGVRWAAFWRDLKTGHDVFEATQVPPTISVCAGRYAVAPAPAGVDGSGEIVAWCPGST
jgi:murein L,D-transpeptidase YafK